MIVHDHISLKFANGVEQKLEDILTPVELLYHFSVGYCTPEINGRVVVLRGGSEYMAHDKYDKCNLKTIFLELARILIDITHEEIFCRAQAMNSSLIHFKG